MGRTGHAQPIRFSEVHIFSNNFRSSYRFSCTPKNAALDSKKYEYAAKLHTGDADSSVTLLTNIEGTKGEGEKNADIIASKFVVKPFTYFLVLSISSPATVDAIVVTIAAFIAEVENAFHALVPEMQKVLTLFGASSLDSKVEKTAINSLLEPLLPRYLQ